MAEYVVPAHLLGRLDRILDGIDLWTEPEWINRGTNQRLRRSTIDQLVRTLPITDHCSPSIRRMHQSAGIRLRLSNASDRKAVAERVSYVTRAHDFA